MTREVQIFFLSFEQDNLCQFITIGKQKFIV